MSKQTDFTVEIYSPTVQGNKTYKFNVLKDQLIITSDAEVKCKFIDQNIDPIWISGVNENPLIQLLELDKVFPPSNFIKAIEMVWFDWIYDKVSNEQIQSSIQSLVDWLNFITKTKPGNDYWADKF
jgi:hypothetical protein